MAMSDYLTSISIGDRIDPPQEAEGARFTWVEDHCELMTAVLEAIDGLEIATDFLDE
jgi:hypothetical protein